MTSYFFKKLFIFGCGGSLLLHGLFSGRSEQGLLFTAVQGLLIAVAYPVAEHRLLGLRASVAAARGLSSWGVQAQQLWPTGSAAPWHVGSFQTRDGTCVSCIGRQILYH